MNLADLILARAARRPDAVAIVEGGQQVRYRHFERAVRAASASLATRGVGVGTVVGLESSHVTTHLVLTLAIARLGAISMPGGAGASLDERLAPLRRVGARLLVGERPLREGTSIGGFEYIVADRSVLDARTQDAPTGWSPDAGDLVWRLTLSSGTTGTQKVIPLTQEHSLTHILAHQNVIAYGPGTRLCLLIGVNISFGLIHALQQLFHGGTVVAFTPRLAETFELCERNEVTHMIASPAAAAQLAAMLDGDAPRLPGMNLYMGGGAVSPRLRDTLASRLTPRLGVIYGSTELGMMTAADPETFARHPDSVGHVVPWALAEAVGGDGTVLAPGHTGELRFQLLGRFDGYLGDAQTTAERLRDGWYYPGDVGSVSRDGLVRVTGRVDDVINLGGLKLLPEQIEQVLETLPGVAQAAAFTVEMGGAEPVLVAAVVPQGESFDEARLLSQARERLGRRAPRRIFRLPALPRNELGKVLRRELARRVRDTNPPAGS